MKLGTERGVRHMSICIKCRTQKKTRESHLCDSCQKEQFGALRNKYGSHVKVTTYDKVVKLLKEGYLQYEIAEKINVSDSMVSVYSSRWIKEKKMEESI